MAESVKGSYCICRMFLLFCTFQLCALDWMHFYNRGEMNDWLDGGITIDSDQNIWACGFDGQFFLPKENVDSCYSYYERVRRAESYCVLHHRSRNEIWFFGRDTMYIHKTGSSETLVSSYSYGGINPNISRAVEGADGNVYAGRYNNNMIVIDGDTKETSVVPGPNEYFLYPDHVDDNGNIWCFGYGISMYDGNQWTWFNENNSGLKGAYFHIEGNKIIEDGYGNIIVATSDEGLFVFDGNEWGPFGSPLPNENLKESISIVRDDNNTFWMSYSEDCGYLAKYSSGQWEIINQIESTRYTEHICNPVIQMVVGEDDRLWLATRHRGIFMINQDTLLSCKPQKQLNITFPSEGSILQTNAYCTIKWKTYGYIPVVNIQYRPENGEWRSVTNRGEEVENKSKETWSLRDSLSGSYQIRVFSTKDSSIADTTGFFMITADGQNVPPILQNIPDSLVAKSDQTTTWTAEATDGNDDSIIFTFVNVPSWATASQATLTLNPTEVSENTTIEVIAADTNGGADTADIYIAVIHSTTTEPGVGAAGPSENMLHEGKKKINLPAGKIIRVTLFNVQGKMIATVDTKNEHTNLLRITKKITDSFVVAKIQYGDKTSIQRTICLIE